MKTDRGTQLGRRMARISAGVGIGALSVMLAAGSAAAYECATTVTVKDNGTVYIEGSGYLPGVAVNVTSDCFAPFTQTTNSTGSFSNTVAVYSSVAPGTLCSVVSDGAAECASTFVTKTTPTTQPPTTQPPTTLPPQDGNGSGPADPPATTVVEVLGNNTDNSDPGDGGTDAPAASSETGKLPFTGMETAGLVAAGALMIGGGAVLVGSVRRRQTV